MQAMEITHTLVPKPKWILMERDSRVAAEWLAALVAELSGYRRLGSRGKEWQNTYGWLHTTAWNEGFPKLRKDFTITE